MSEHPSPENVGYLLYGVLPDDTVREISLHVLDGCTACRSMLDPRSAAILTGETERALSAMLRAHRREKSLRKEAANLFINVGPESLETAPRRLRGVAGLVVLLHLSQIAGSKARWLQIPFALFARLLADQLDPREHGERQVADLRCQAALQLAQGYLFGGNVERAEQAIGWSAADFLHGFQRPRLKACILDIWALIDAVQGRHEKARQGICAALAIYRELGDHDGEALTLARMSLQESFAGETEEGIKLMRQARLALDEERYPDLYFRTIHRQVKLLVSIGRFREARILLWTNLGRYAAHGGELDQVERTGLEGVINSGLGNLIAAERDLLDAVIAFADLQEVRGVALTSLDLAVVFQEQGRPEDARESANIAIGMYQHLEIPEEAHAALLVLKEAFDRGLVDSDLLRRTARYMRDLSHNSEARFLAER